MMVLNGKPCLRLLVLGGNCGGYTMALTILNCPQLEQVLIRKNSFGFSLVNANQMMKLRVSNCRSLKKLIIEEGSFTNYSKLELQSLPKLQELIIGTLNKAKKSKNFSRVSVFDLRNLPALRSVLIGTYSFADARCVYFSRLCGGLD